VAPSLAVAVLQRHSATFLNRRQQLSILLAKHETRDLRD
jgi:hypothetical protein